MTRFLYGDLLWKADATRRNQAQRIKSAIAYVTRLPPLSLKSGDVLIVDATDGAIGSGQTSAAVLDSLFRKGVNLYSHTGLHAKIIIADSVLFASSANLSALSVSKLLEAGIETDYPNAVSGARGLIEGLRQGALEAKAQMLGMLFKMAVSGRHPAMTMFFLKTRGGWSETGNRAEAIEPDRQYRSLACCGMVAAI